MDNTSTIAPVKHTLFDCTESLVIFQVENQLFRIPIRHFTMHSPHFQAMTDLVPSEGQAIDGQSDDQPIVLYDKAGDFEALLNYFHPDISNFVGRKEEWISILRLAHKYEMEKIKSVAVEKLQSCRFGVFEMINLADEFDIPMSWAQAALNLLCSRKHPLSVTESLLLRRPDWASAISSVSHKIYVQDREGTSWDAASILIDIQSELAARPTSSNDLTVPRLNHPQKKKKSQASLDIRDHNIKVQLAFWRFECER